MIRKYWKGILAFFISLSIAIFLLHNGEEYFDKEVLGIVFSVFATIALVLGIGLFVWIWADRSVEKRMKRKLTEEELKEQEKWAGRLEVENKILSIYFGGNEKLDIKVSELKVIGEFTTDADPIATDWYLILVKENNEVVYLPVYAVGFQEAIKKLSEVLGEEISPKLFSSIQFDSNILFPKNLKDKKLFDFEGINPSGIWDKIKLNLGFKSITPILRKEIIEFRK